MLTKTSAEIIFYGDTLLNDYKNKKVLPAEVEGFKNILKLIKNAPLADEQSILAIHDFYQSMDRKSIFRLNVQSLLFWAFAISQPRIASPFAMMYRKGDTIYSSKEIMTSLDKLNGEIHALQSPALNNRLMR